LPKPLTVAVEFADFSPESHSAPCRGFGSSM
jgi:hypothetical protein